MRTALSSLIRKWNEEGVEVLDALPSADVAAFFGRVDIPVASDVVELYSYCGGFQQDQYTEHEFFSLWSIARIEQELNTWTSELLQFGDHSIDLYRYGLRKEDESKSSRWAVHDDQGGSTHKLTDSLGEFLLHLTLPDSCMW